MEQSNNQPNTRATIAIFAVYFLAMGIGTVTPAMHSIIGHWSEQGVATSSILLVNTLPTLAMVFTMLFIGPLVGKRIKYKTAAMLGCACFALFGTMPAVFTDSFPFVLVCRALFGIGLGLVTPLGNALVIGLFQGNRQATFLGYGSLVMNFGGIVLQMLGGTLSPTADTWNMCFWPHALGFISLIMCAFIPEPEKQASKNPGNAKAKGKFPPYVWIGSAVLLLANMVNFALLMNSSVWVSFTGADNVSFIASIAVSCFTAGGMVSSLLFGNIYKKLGSKTVSLGVACMAVGALLVYICGTDRDFILGGFIVDGFGFSLVLTGVNALVGAVVVPQQRTHAVSTVMACVSLGSFLSTYYLIYIVAPIFQGMGHANDVTGYYYGEFVAAIVVLLVLAVFTFFHDPTKHNDD